MLKILVLSLFSIPCWATNYEFQYKTWFAPIHIETPDDLDPQMEERLIHHVITAVELLQDVGVDFQSSVKFFKRRSNQKWTPTKSFHIVFASKKDFPQYTTDVQPGLQQFTKLIPGPDGLQTHEVHTVIGLETLLSSPSHPLTEYEEFSATTLNLIETIATFQKLLFARSAREVGTLSFEQIAQWKIDFLTHFLAAQPAQEDTAGGKGLRAALMASLNRELKRNKFTGVKCEGVLN